VPQHCSSQAARLVKAKNCSLAVPAPGRGGVVKYVGVRGLRRGFLSQGEGAVKGCCGREKSGLERKELDSWLCLSAPATHLRLQKSRS